MYRVLSLLALMWFAESAFAAGVPAPTWPFWDGQESTEQYARRTNLPPTKTLDLGNSVSLELVLIPAGKFIMGTPEPMRVDEDSFRKKIVVGKAVFAVGVGVLLTLIGFAILRAIRERRRFQYSLRRFMGMIFALKATGKRLGRPAGSKVDAAKVGRLLAEGQSYRQTAKALGCSAGTIHRLAKQSRKPSSVLVVQ